MSSRCHCPFSGPSDSILGCHRDPITSEKGWLDFAVRELSRVAAGKARGQEAVWRSQCKPEWWDSECRYPWKNPTANPKDSKDTLKAKFECLVQHLRKEELLPREMEKEVELWEADCKSEVFLMTSFSSLLGQASNLHTVVEAFCHRIEELGISVDNSIVTDLQSCLTASIKKLESIKNVTDEGRKGENSRATKGAGNKRRSHATDSDLSQTPCKRFKDSSQASPHLSPSPSPPSPSLVQPSTSALSTSPHPTQALSSTPPSQTVTFSQSVFTDQSKMLLALLQKQLLERKVAKTAVATPASCQTVTQLKPKVRSICSSKHRTGKKTGVGAVGGEGNVASAVGVTVSVPLPVSLSATLPQNSTLDMAETSEFLDFLQLDLRDTNDDADCQVLKDSQFLDDLLQEECPDVSVGDRTTATPLCSVPQAVPDQSPTPADSPLVQKGTETRFSHDPFFGHSLTTSDMPDSIPFHFDILPEEVADKQLEVEGTEGCIGTVLCSGVGDMDRGLHDTEHVSDSGYNSECSVATSHRSSLDSDYSNFSDLCNPDLEAYLDSL